MKFAAIIFFSVALLTGPADSAPSKSRDFVASHFSSVAVIEGDLGNGTGFFVRENDQVHLYTAAHVLCGNTRLEVKNVDGRKFRNFGVFEVAKDADLARLELTGEFDTALSLSSAGVLKVGDPLLAIGNSGGAGVLTVLDGKVVSLGPSAIELSNGVIQGNSGGPIFSGTTGKVVGAVTHAVAARDDVWAEDTEFAKVRRFATRLDREIEWHRMPIGHFLAEGRILEKCNRNTRLLFAIAALDPTADGLRLGPAEVLQGDSILTVFRENEDVPIVKELIEMNTGLGDQGMRSSSSDLKRHFGSYYREALRDLNRDRKPDPKTFSPYNREAAREAVEARARAVKAIESARERIGR